MPKIVQNKGIFQHLQEFHSRKRAKVCNSRQVKSYRLKSLFQSARLLSSQNGVSSLIFTYVENPKGPDSVNGMAFGSKGEKVLATQEAIDFALLSFTEASEGDDFDFSISETTPQNVKEKTIVKDGVSNQSNSTETNAIEKKKKTAENIEKTIDEVVKLPEEFCEGQEEENEDVVEDCTSTNALIEGEVPAQVHEENKEISKYNLSRISREKRNAVFEVAELCNRVTYEKRAENNTESRSVSHQLVVSRTREKRKWITEIDCESDSELSYRPLSESSVMKNAISRNKNHNSNMTAAKVPAKKFHLV